MEAAPKGLGAAARPTTPVLLIPGCYIFHINYCWSQVNLYLLNMRCLGVGSPVSKSFLGCLFVWSVVNVFIFLLLCMWSDCLCLPLFPQLDHVQLRGKASTGNSGLQHLLNEIHSVYTLLLGGRREFACWSPVCVFWKELQSSLKV